MGVGREVSISLDGVRDKNMMQLKKLNAALFPVRYNDKYYADAIASGEFTKLGYVANMWLNILSFGHMLQNLLTTVTYVLVLSRAGLREGKSGSPCLYHDIRRFTTLSRAWYCLPGDYGFDPLGLSDPEGTGGFIEPKWLAYGEIINGRFAMLGAAGAIAPEILGKAGLIPEETTLPWFKTGKIPRLDPWGSNTFWGLRRVWEAPAYPGGPFFNALGFGKDEKSLKDLKQKEVKNGRLAMLAILGYFVQAVVTGVGPYQNLLDHLADPVHNNVLTSLQFH
ncbi:hypothetical protein L6164_031652 [Bauhinia variegata]|uniref:Uncharacterized protein n=1 Tax=Bauhinia variegata TaxID=167791 RepID=A0ACB9LGI2_BAUVA|nr:hypothetical protein L6164_031652 [Bauhinia variegata]